MSDTERRVKVFSVDAYHVLDWFALAAGWRPGTVVVPRVPVLPDGCKVLVVNHDFYSRRFQFLVGHPDFPEVPPGELPPDVSCDVVYEAVATTDAVQPDDPVLVSV